MKILTGRTLVLLFVQFFLIIQSFSQKEANVWYFGSYAGLDFNSGQPDVLGGMFSAHCSSACISDSAGNFLFATNTKKIWNRNLEIMQNGDGINGTYAPTQAALIVPKPGSDHLFYVFIVKDARDSPGLYYSIIDIEMDDGLGAVIEKNIPISAAWDAVEKLTAVKHKNGIDVWIITRKNSTDYFASFLLTSSGINPEPILSYSPEQPIDFMRGHLKVSYDKKYIIALFLGEGLPNDSEFDRSQICHFDATTGEIDFMYWIDSPFGIHLEDPHSIEFSSDSKLVSSHVY